MFIAFKKIFLLGLIFAGLASVVYAADPLADGLDECGVPVCQPQDTLQALRVVDANKRGDWAMKLKGRYAKSENILVLNNLYEFGKKLKVLYTELSENPSNDWVLREAFGLLNNAVLSLAKFGDFDAVKFATYYAELANQNARYDMLSYWTGKAAKIEEVKFLNGLVSFATAARGISINLQDDAWVARAATELINFVTVRLTALDPAHEGLYEITLEDGHNIFPFDKMTVLESSSVKNLIVSFVNTKHNVVVYSFKNAEIDGNTIRGEVVSGSFNSTQFEFTLNRDNGEVTGYVSDILHEVAFTGVQTQSTRSVFAGVPDRTLDAEAVIGEFSGQILGLNGVLTVKYRPSKKLYIAVFISENGELNIPFAGKFYPKNGVLALTHNNAMKLVISLRNNSWNGILFSTNTGKSVDVQFSKL